MAPSPQHDTLAAGEVTTMTFDVDFAEVEVMNVDGAAEVYFRFDGTDPTVAGDGCDVLPAAISSGNFKPGTSGPTVLKLISAGTPKVTARGLT
jgi:hypothetical protein